MDTPPDLRAALALAARAGAYFEVELLDDPSEPAPWRPLRELAQDDAVLDERVQVARDFLAARTAAPVDLRACASINSLGVASRLVSPALATAVLARVVPDLSVDAVRWQAVDGEPLPLAIGPGTRAAAVVGDAHAAARAIDSLVLEPLVRPVLEHYRARFGVSPKTLWGNVASALAGAAGMLRRSGLPLVLDPDDVVGAMLAGGAAAGAGRYEHPDADDARLFVRTNCCLFYRIPAAGKCQDCVLVPAAARQAIWRAATGRES